MFQIILGWVMVVIVGSLVIWLTIDTIIRIVHYNSNKTPNVKISELEDQKDNLKDDRKE